MLDLFSSINILISVSLLIIVIELENSDDFSRTYVPKVNMFLINFSTLSFRYSIR